MLLWFNVYVQCTHIYVLCTLVWSADTTGVWCRVPQTLMTMLL